MFDGKRFFPVTGMPMRKIACMRRLLALADPVPFTLASFTAKSLTPAVVAVGRARSLHVVNGAHGRVPLAIGFRRTA